MSAGPEEIARAVAQLREGRLVAFPTETVYGLGALATDERAVGRVFAMKGRPPGNPLIVHVSGEEMARTLTPRWTERASRLANAFWPGPLTIVVERGQRVPSVVSGGGPTVAVRCPAHPLTLALIEMVGEGIVGPSANRSGFLSPTSAAHVEDEFREEIERGDLMVLDGGACRAGIESTVVSVVRESPEVLRPGVIGASEVARALGCDVRERRGSDDPAAGPMASPGRMESHYAPRTRAVLLPREEIGRAIEESGVPIALVAIAGPGRPRVHTHIEMPGDAIGYASSLYRALREADASGVELIIIERPPTGGTDAEIWAAIHDRLARATAPRV
ncbi:MAG: threonylcarbamoyl-AMP synthase [Phycisphaeraceae bacterium]|nr:threonylcarbamoyl-AMP synthase [Phycisphaeraceae bacterium]